MPVLFMNQRIDDENLTMLEDAFNTFNIYLEEQDWAAGNQMTVADYSLVASVSTAEVQLIVNQVLIYFTSKVWLI